MRLQKGWWIPVCTVGFMGVIAQLGGTLLLTSFLAGMIWVTFLWIKSDCSERSKK